MTPVKVLYIEDNLADQVVMKDLFGPLPGYELTIAASLSEGLNQLVAHSFDVVLTDYYLNTEPCLPIIEAAGTKVPVILITGAGDESVAVRSMKLGASDYLIKGNNPRFFNDVLNSIDSAIKLFTTEVRLNEAQKQFHDLFENAHDLIQSVYTDGQIEFVNPSWVRAMQYHPGELKTITFLDVVHSDFHNYWLDLMSQFNAGLEATKAELKLISRSGQPLFVEGHLHRVVEKGIIKVRGVIRNITERKEAEAELSEMNRRLTEANIELENLSQNLHNLVDQKSGELQSYQEAIDMNIFSAVLSTKGLIQKVNKPLVELSGYSEVELIGQNFLIAFTDAQPYEFYDSIKSAFLSHEAWRGEVKIKTKSGADSWLDLTIIPVIKDNQIANFLSLALSITERKEAEEKQNNVLKLLEAIAFQTSHSVRGPMARIQGLVNLLENNLLNVDEFTMLARKIKENAIEIDSATRTLAEYVNTNYQSMNNKEAEVVPETKDVLM